MNTPNIDSFFTEVAALRNSQASFEHANKILQAKYDQARKELNQKQESWDKAANYRDEVLELRSELALQQDSFKRLEREFFRQRDEKAKLANEVVDLEKRINEPYVDILYHMGAIDRLAGFIKPRDLTSEGVVSAAIDKINRLIEEVARGKKINRELGEERLQLQRWKDEALTMQRQWDSIDAWMRNHPECVVGDSVVQNVGKWLQERDYFKKKLQQIKELF